MKKICTELSESSKEKGFTMHANLNADCIKALKRWNKEDAKKISEAIKTGNVKNAATPVGILYRRRGKKKVEMQENHDSYRNCTEELMYEYDR